MCFGVCEMGKAVQHKACFAVVHSKKSENCAKGEYRRAWPRRAWGEAMSLACGSCMWVVVKIMVHFWVPIIIRHLIFRVPKKGP